MLGMGRAEPPVLAQGKIRRAEARGPNGQEGGGFLVM